MKYFVSINQKQVLEAGITNINQAVIFDLIANAATWAKPITTDDGVFYWVARQLICDELPILKIKPDTVYRHLKNLSELGLIDYQKDGLKDIVRLTKKGKEIYVGNEPCTMLETDPAEHGNESENGSETTPTYQYTNNINKTNIKAVGGKKKKPVEPPDWLPVKAWEDFKAFRREIKAPLGKVGESRALAELGRLRAAGHEPTAVLNQSILNGWRGLFPIKTEVTVKKPEPWEMPGII